MLFLPHGRLDNEQSQAYDERMNLDSVRKNPSYYTACQWCYGVAFATACTCTQDCQRPVCPMKEEAELYPRPAPIPTFAP